MVKNKSLIIIIIFVCSLVLCSYIINKTISKNNNSKEKNRVENNSESKLLEKGYNLPIDDEVEKNAEKECKKVMQLVSDIYSKADKGEALNAVISDKIIENMLNTIGDKEYVVIVSKPYYNMGNYEKMDKFLKKCTDGKKESIVLYRIQSEGGIGREEYSFDGTNMYILNTIASWSDNNKPIISYTTYDRIKKWKYTDKGWFCYEVCVPKPPEVSETVDGSCLIRVKPMTKEQQELSKKCVSIISYQGNNLLCSNWDENHMKDLDYNGLYEYLYFMKYNKRLEINSYPNGIPKGEFEKIIMEYLPITSKQIEKYAVFDRKKQTYPWERLGCFNYIANFFGTAFPEVVDIKENKNGTVTLTVDAVCEMMLCNDSVISHELTVRFEEDGSFKYLANKILNDGIKAIPEYQYRIKK